MPERAKTYRTPALPKRAPDKGRPDATQRGYDRKWKRCRAAYLASNPVCVRCLPRVVEAVHVHHKDEQGPKGPNGYDPDNLESLCESCHNRETARARQQRNRPTFS